MSKPAFPVRSRRVLRAAALLGAAAGSSLTSGCTRAPLAQPASAAAPAVAPIVQVVVPSSTDVTRTITQPGTIQGIEEATLYAKTAGYLKTVYVDKGDRVRRGQVLAVLESPELGFQQEQARATYRQAVAATEGVVAGKGRAQADVAQAASGVERARAEVRQAEAVIGRAKADLARTEAQLPKLEAGVREAEANVQQAQEQQAQAQAEIARVQQQLKGAQAALRAVQATYQKAQADQRLAQVTHERLKAIQDKDAGLIPAQDVDVARARRESAQSEVEAARSRVEAAREEAAAVEQSLESARRSAAAAARKVDAARSRVEAAREEVKAHAREIDAAKQQVSVAEAQRDAAKSQVGVAESQRQALQAQVRVADAQIRASRLQNEGSRSALSAAGALAGYTRIEAPFDGVVTERLADPGAFIQNAGGNQAAAKGIVKVVRDQSLRVMVPVPETNIPYIRKGRTATLAVDAYPKATFTGRVTRFASAVDPKSRTMLTEIQIPNGDGRLRPGMYVRVTLEIETRHNALTVPTEAVVGKDAERFVYTVVDGKAVKTPVTVGFDDGKAAEITGGLEAGTPVVVTGRDTLVNGALVKTEPYTPPVKK